MFTWEQWSNIHQIMLTIRTMKQHYQSILTWQTIKQHSSNHAYKKNNESIFMKSFSQEVQWSNINQIMLTRRTIIKSCLQEDNVATFIKLGIQEGKWRNINHIIHQIHCIHFQYFPHPIFNIHHNIFNLLRTELRGTQFWMKTKNKRYK